VRSIVAWSPASVYVGAQMPGLSLVRHVAAAHPARASMTPRRPRAEPEHVEEVWDAELVGELALPGWLAAPALTTYTRAGFSAPPPRIDVRA
jgi:hypothetical protein